MSHVAGAGRADAARGTEGRSEPRCAGGGVPSSSPRSPESFRRRGAGAHLHLHERACTRGRGEGWVKQASRAGPPNPTHASEAVAVHASGILVWVATSRTREVRDGSRSTPLNMLARAGHAAGWLVHGRARVRCQLLSLARLARATSPERPLSNRAWSVASGGCVCTAMHAVGDRNCPNVPEVESQTETPSMRIAHMRMSENRQTSERF